jgi:dipeptidyl aminopeptidase/acylaminoacyl peptidase
MYTYRDFRPNRRLQQTLALTTAGDYAAYVDDGTGQFNIAVQATTGGAARRITHFTDSTVRRVAWHPDGQSLVFTADTQGNEKAQVYRIGLSDDSPQVLTNASQAQHVLAHGQPFSPDGRWIAYVANDRSPGDQDVLIRDLVTGETRRLHTGGGRVFAGHWAPDGTQLTAAEWVDGNSDHIVYLVPVDGQPATRLTPEGVTATYWLGPWLPDGDSFLVRTSFGQEFTGLATMNAVTGELTWIDRPDWEVEAVALSGDGGTLAWVVNVDGASELRVRNLLTGTDLDLPSLPQGEIVELSLSHDGRIAVFLMSTSTRPWNAAVLDFGTGELTWATDIAPIAADPTAFVEPAPIRYPGLDGSRIPGFLYLSALT